MSYARMHAEEVRLEREIAGLLKQAEAADRVDEAEHARMGMMAGWRRNRSAAPIGSKDTSG